MYVKPEMLENKRRLMINIWNTFRYQYKYLDIICSYLKVLFIEKRKRAIKLLESIEYWCLI